MTTVGTKFIQVGETCDGCNRSWVECECWANATMASASSDWMDEEPDWAPGNGGEIKSNHRTIDGLGIVGLLRKGRSMSKRVRSWLSYGQPK